MAPNLASAAAPAPAIATVPEERPPRPVPDTPRRATTEPRAGLRAAVGAVIGFALVITIVTVVGTLAGLGVGAAIGLGAFLGLWGGAGFGFMMGGSAAIAAHDRPVPRP